MAVIGVVFPFLIGTVVGTLAGFFGGWIDVVCMRIIDVVLAFGFSLTGDALADLIGVRE